jgi:apolipoprotein N-acyltransferase
LLTGFPWENLGFSQFQNLPFIQISNIIGAFGISFIIILINYVIFQFLFVKEISKKQALVELFLTSFIIILVLSYGYFNIYNTSVLTSRKKPLKVALIQGNIGMFQKWKITKKSTTDIYLNLTKKALRFHPALALWPETALPYILSLSPKYWNKVMNFTEKNKIDLIFGAIGIRFINGRVHYYNRDYMFTKSGKYSYYDKNHLVPFGEYIPLRHQLPFLAHILKGAGIGNFTPGKKFRILKGGKLKAGSMICYEAYFDSLVRHFSKNGANFYISITDDAWYGKTAAPYQDMSMTVFSAVENDRYVARAGNSGISGIISPIGKIVMQTKIFKKTFMIGRIKLINHKTFFALYGNIFAYTVMMFFLLSITYIMISKGLDRLHNKHNK